MKPAGKTASIYMLDTTPANRKHAKKQANRQESRQGRLVVLTRPVLNFSAGKETQSRITGW
jgi:hypothetical protein